MTQKRLENASFCVGFVLFLLLKPPRWILLEKRWLVVLRCYAKIITAAQKTRQSAIAISILR